MTRTQTLVLGTAVDYSGVTRAKGAPISRLDAFVTAGMGASPSWVVFCVDSGIAFTPDLGVTGDLRLRLDADHLAELDDDVLWGPTTMHTQDGTVFAGCPRARLIAVLDRLRDAGLAARTGAELEFFLLGPDSAPRGGTWNGYGVRAALEVEPFLVDLLASCARAGVPVEQLHAEYGTDQFELSLAPADPLTTADRTVLTRILVGRAAARHGLTVSFAPMPFAGGTGNGAHLHLSLADGDVPLLSGGDGPHGLTTRGGQAVAGVVSALPGLQGIYAGSVASPLRLKPGHWSGAFACWGLENREAGVRFVEANASNPRGANVELKVIDASANPYLAATALVGSALDGIERTLPLPAEVDVDPASLPSDDPRRVPLAGDQATALDALEASTLARSLLGGAVLSGLLAVRRYEQSTWGSQPAEAIAGATRLAFSC